MSRVRFTVACLLYFLGGILLVTSSLWRGLVTQSDGALLLAEAILFAVLLVYVGATR